jgi:transcriptional regulator with XRE-family HTH domain
MIRATAMATFWDGRHRACTKATYSRHHWSFMKTERPPARMRLPEGFSHLCADLGHRTGVRGVVDPISQHKLACSVGISRVGLSRIENGHTLPQGSTLDRIMEELELDWSQVAIAGDSGRPALLFDGSLQGTKIYQLCQSLRLERKALGWSLAELSRRSGVSAAQLSRIERAQGGRSGVLTWHPHDLGKVPEDRRVVFGNPILADLAAGRFDCGPDEES